MTILAGQIIRAADLNGLLGELVAYTPSNSNIVVGNGLMTGEYVLVGPLCYVSWVLQFGSTTSFSGGVSIGLPFEAASPNALEARMGDAGTRNYIGQAAVTAGSALAGLRHTESGNSGNVNATNPFTWTTNDTIVVGGVYVPVL